MDKTIEQLIEERDTLHNKFSSIDVTSGMREFLDIAAKLSHIYEQIKKLGYSPYIKKEDLI